MKSLKSDHGQPSRWQPRTTVFVSNPLRLSSLRGLPNDYCQGLCILGQLGVQAVASLTNFLPTLVKSFGFNTINTLLLTAPPYVVTAAFCVLCTWLSDRFSKRSPFIMINIAIAAVGIIITLATTNVPARYFALFLMLPGSYGCFQISNAWMANIGSRPQKKRAITLAMNNAFGNTALIWTPYLYPSSAGPRYVKGVHLSLRKLKKFC